VPAILTPVKTGIFVLLLLSLQRLGMRLILAMIAVLIGTIGLCYFIEILVVPETTPNLGAFLK
jgi:manganese transport protein